MRPIMLAAAAMAALSVSINEASAQVQQRRHAGSFIPGNGGIGFSSPGYSTFMQPNGVTQTWMGTGDTRIYSDSTGTTGMSTFLPGGRMDSYSNGRQGWSGSGFTPYVNPAATSYRRNYFGW